MNRRKHKYNAKSTTIDGIKFPSLREANRYRELKLLERAGEISNLELQPRFELHPKFKNKDNGNIRAIHYVADFRYIEGDQTIIEDSKGVQTPEFKIKRKLFLFKYPDLTLRIT